MISITNKAADKLRSLDRSAIRIFLQKGGCATYKYGFSLDMDTPDLIKTSHNGIDIMVSEEDLDKLSEVEIDHESNLMGEKFVIGFNPYATEKCRCGISFSGIND